VNRGSRSNRPFDPKAEELGIAGELALAWLAGMEDHQPRRNRNPWTIEYGGFKIKVVTSRNPRSLFIKPGRVDADIYILSGVGAKEEIVPENVWWCGWASSADVKAAPVVTPRHGHRDTYVQPVHQVSRADLRPMAELCTILGFDPDRLHRRTTKPASTEPHQRGLNMQSGPGRDFEH
jgi:hypothetical protein